MAASTTALPPLTCTARGKPSHRQLLFLLRGRPSVAVCFEACAERSVCRLCLPAVPCSAGFLCACHSLPAMPTALIICPRSVALPPFICFVCHVHVHVRQDRCQGQQFASCKTVPLAAATRACSGGPCAGSILTFLFPAESMILGHGFSVNL